MLWRGTCNFSRRKGRVMAADPRTLCRSICRKIWQTLSSIKTGVILLIVVVIISAAGTVILQRPVTEPDEMTRAYSPSMLSVLDKLGLTDVFHAWWFVSLLALVSSASLRRRLSASPMRGGIYARPYNIADESFRRALATQKHIPIPNEETGLGRASAPFARAGFRPGTHRGSRSSFVVRRAEPHVGDGGVHRACQPAVDIPWRHRGWHCRAGEAT